MTQAILKTTGKRLTTPLVREAEGERLPPMNHTLDTDRGVLRAIADELDVIGKDPYGCTWALVRTTPQLLQYLEAMDASTENDEDSDDDGGGIYDDRGRVVTEDDEPNGDIEQDLCDYENDQSEDQPHFGGHLPGVTY